VRLRREEDRVAAGSQRPPVVRFAATVSPGRLAVCDPLVKRSVDYRMRFGLATERAQNALSAQSEPRHDGAKCVDGSRRQRCHLGTLVIPGNVIDNIMDIRLPWCVPALATVFLVGLATVSAAADPPKAVGPQVWAPSPVAPARSRWVAMAPSDEPKDAKAEERPKAEHAKNGGVVEGQVVSVDYQSGVIGLMTADRGRVDVMVLPSTNIQGRGDSFHTIADIARGSRLRIFLSQRAGQFFAQIIHLR
jgi:hypothetical protein